MFDERSRGTYIKEFEKTIEDKTYTKKETSMINDKNECISFVREYNPPIKFGLEEGGWIEKDLEDNDLDFSR